MKTFHSVSKLFLLLTGLMASAASCIRPDLSDCPRQNVRITVTTHTEASRAENDRYDIQNATIYVFDASGRFVTAWEGGEYIYGQPYTAELELDPGTYRFVVWTNQGESYTSTHSVSECHQSKPSLSELTYYLNCPADNTLTADLPDLHHGILQNAVVTADILNEFTVVLTPNTYTLNFTVEGLPADGNDYTFKVTDNNSHYTFDNTILGGQLEFSHLRATRFTESEELTASMKVLRLTADREPLFDFADATGGESLYANGLVTMIRRAYGSASRADLASVLATTFEYNITITFRANVGVNVEVNGWSYFENNTEL